MRWCIVSLCCCLVTGAVAFAQDRPESPRNRVNRQFNERAPAVGDALPDVAGLDAAGREFRLAELKGHYTVLVFGCLT